MNNGTIAIVIKGAGVNTEQMKSLLQDLLESKKEDVLIVPDFKVNIFYRVLSWIFG